MTDPHPDRGDRQARAAELRAQLEGAPYPVAQAIREALAELVPYPGWCFQPVECAGRLSCAGRSCLD